jgi:hypothetical protein
MLATTRNLAQFPVCNFLLGTIAAQMPYLLAVLPLYPNAGVPMIFFTLPAMGMLLVPIILVEGFLCKKWLGLTTWKALKLNAASNLTSTLIGVPLAWAIMFGIELLAFRVIKSNNAIQNWDSPIVRVVWLLVGSAWLGPISDKGIWLIPAATLVLLVPFFFASYAVEYLVIKLLMGTDEGGQPNLAYPRVPVAVRNANLATYGAMFVGTSIWLAVSFIRR